MQRWVVWVLFALGGCSGGGASVVDGMIALDASPTSNGGVAPLASLDDACDGQPALTGRSISDALQPSYAATYIAQGLAMGTALTITTTYEGGEILCHPQISSCSMCGAPDVPAYIELRVATHFQTADGTFAERFTASVVSGLFLQGQIAIDQIQGSFRPAIGGVWDTHQVSFGGDLSVSGTTEGSVVEQASRVLSGGTTMGQTLGAGAWK
jgi:hypothetical protein